MRKQTGQIKKPLTIIFAVSEAVPFVKTGGLADVGGALPKALASLGHDVHLFLPFYGAIDRDLVKAKKAKADITVPVATRLPRAKIFSIKTGGVNIHLLENDGYFGREHLYNTPAGDYPDNCERFSFFCRGILEAAKALKLKPDIVHANDWQTALLPVYLKKLYAADPVFHKTVSVFTIHNLGYQGHFNAGNWRHTGLDWSLYSGGALEFYGGMNFMKAGLVFADVITTVSPTYANEIKSAEHGWGMDGILRSRAADLCGILNGIDDEDWNPAKDKLIAERFSPSNLAGKKACKAELLAEMGLASGDEPVIGVVSRLVEQKGMDILFDVADTLLDAGAKIAILGSGSSHFENIFRELASRRPRQAATHIGYNEGLAHRIEAGADIFLMPSRYEPCGLNQMYSLRYGTVPVVRATGGLNDTVSEFDPVAGTGNGFKFYEPTAHALHWKTAEAMTIMRARPDDWFKMVKRGMKEDHSWAKSAKAYIGVYEKALANREK